MDLTVIPVYYYEERMGFTTIAGFDQHEDIQLGEFLPHWPTFLANALSSMDCILRKSENLVPLPMPYNTYLTK